MAKKLTALLSDDFLTGITKEIQGVTDPAKFEEYIKTHTFDADQLPPEDSAILYFKGKPIGDRGNVVAITGKAKSRKTVVASAIGSSFFLKDEEFLGFHFKVKEGEPILHIDTEQGYRHYYKAVKRILDNARLTGTPPNLTSLHTRDAAVDFLIELTEYLIRKYKPSVVILDGVTDLIYDINSQSEATIIGRKLLSLSEESNALIIAVIHLTKTTGFMTGAIGTYLEKKCQTTIKVEKDENDDKVSHISCQYARDEPFPGFSIRFDQESDKYVFQEETEVETKGKGGRTDPQAYGELVHKSILDRMFIHREAYKEKEITGAIRAGVKNVTNDVIPKKIMKSWLEYYSYMTWIVFTPGEVWVRNTDGSAWVSAARSTPSESTAADQAGLFDDVLEVGTPVDQSQNDDDLPF